MNHNSIILSEGLNKNTYKLISEKTNLKVIHLNEDILIGSLARVNNKKGIISPKIDKEESQLLKDSLKIETVEMTTNFGNNFISAGIALNDSGYIISELSSAVETYEIDQFLRE